MPVPVPVVPPVDPVTVDVPGRPGRPTTGRFCSGSEVSVANGAMPWVREPETGEKLAAATAAVPWADEAEEWAAWLTAWASGRSWVMVEEATGWAAAGETVK